ncbi:MAG TPA: glycosyltransferase, partial [Trebonia sp.]|nr:glycosyltransferase [Trebonia sp.]
MTVGIPTWARGERVLVTIARILACDPRPAEIIVHVDAGDGALERALTEKFPGVKVLASPHRVGPGGGRHRCLLAARQPYFVSFDDDSWPVDADFFAEVIRQFDANPTVSLLAAAIAHPWEQMPDRHHGAEFTVE